MLSEGMPMHIPLRGAVVAEKDGSFAVALEPGSGTAPDLEGRLRPGAAELPAAWGECFPVLPRLPRLLRAAGPRPVVAGVVRPRHAAGEFFLAIPLEECQPLQGEVRSRAAEGYVGAAAALCFRVPRVAFQFRGEHYDYRRG